MLVLQLSISETISLRCFFNGKFWNLCKRLPRRVCIAQLSEGLHAHLSISYAAVPIAFAGCVTLLIAIVRIVSTSRRLKEMNLALCEFEKQWNQEESLSYNLQGNAYNAFSFVNKSPDNFSPNSFSDKKVDHLPIPVTNYHQRLPMPPRRAILY
ncbi:unnamed protein product [Schistosoma rodhaini]|uniref:Uncharacterized protein n=1 Tax=Schistosoma rodhaini TaxID=6188 RepID=A0AA85EKG6_9TREM|nr:unnamed protein product [Schistosoma rodhaini]